MCQHEEKEKGALLGPSERKVTTKKKIYNYPTNKYILDFHVNRCLSH